MRASQQPSWQRWLSPEGVRLRFHTLCPHPALTPVPVDAETLLAQQDNEIAWSLLLVDRVLPMILPPEDIQNPCLDVLVSEVFAGPVVHGSILGRASQPWLLWEGVTKLLQPLRPEVRKSLASNSTPGSQLEQFGLLTPKRASSVDDRHLQARGRVDSVVAAFWSAIQLAIFGWALLRAFATALMHAHTIPARSKQVAHTSDLQGRPSIAQISADVDLSTDEPSPREHSDARPIIHMRIWACVSCLLSIEQRMPWLSGSLSLLQWLCLFGPGQVCRTNSRLDR